MSDSASPKKSRSAKCQSTALGCGRFLFNRKEGTVMGRTGKSWLLIMVFYMVFFSLLAGFFSLLLYIFLAVFIKDSAPYQTGDNSILKAVAGLNANPRTSAESSLVIISTNPKDGFSLQYESASNQLFQKAFGEGFGNGTTCLSNQDQPGDVSNFCRYNKAELGPCADPVAQMNASRLCVFIRINRVFGWLPDVVNLTSSKDILLDCVGQNPADVVNLRKPTYYPSFQEGSKSYGVIPNRFFPFINQKGYVSPIVAVQFPRMKTNVAILVQCQVRNLRNAYKNVKFEVMLLDKKV